MLARRRGMSVDWKDLVVDPRCRKTNCVYCVVIAGWFGCQDGIGLRSMTKPQNLEIRGVTCEGFSQATSEGMPNHSNHITTSFTHHIDSTFYHNDQ